MRKSRFTESQIVSILKQGESGVPIAEILRQHGISKATYFHWRSKYAGASVEASSDPRHSHRPASAQVKYRRSRTAPATTLPTYH
jgi:transposase-like protein